MIWLLLFLCGTWQVNCHDHQIILAVVVIIVNLNWLYFHLLLSFFPGHPQYVLVSRRKLDEIFAIQEYVCKNQFSDSEVMAGNTVEMEEKKIGSPAQVKRETT